MNSDQFFFAIFGLDSISLRLKNKDLICSEIFGGVACNGKGLCEVRATATGSGEENRTLAKTFSIF